MRRPSPGRSRTLVRALNRFALAVALLVALGLLAALLLTAMFLDDPAADGTAVLTWFTTQLAAVALLAAGGQVGSRLVAWCTGSVQAAAFVAVLPVLLMAAGAIYLAG